MKTSVVLILWAIFEFYVKKSEGTGGVRQRNSSVPIRQLIQRSRLSLLLAKRNGTGGDDEDCAVCDPLVCRNRVRLETEDLYCMRSINEDTETEIEECVNETELHSNFKNQSHFDEREGCETDHSWELCWCQANRLPPIGVVKVKSRMRKIQNVVQEKRLKSMIPNSFNNNYYNNFFPIFTGILSCLYYLLIVNYFL